MPVVLTDQGQRPESYLRSTVQRVYFLSGFIVHTGEGDLAKNIRKNCLL